MPDIVISEFMDEAAIEELLAGRDHHYDPKLVDDPDALHDMLADARAIVVRNRTQVRGGLLQAAPKLKAVGRLGVGLDNIDLDDCKVRGVAVFPAVGANNIAVAEYVIATAMMLIRGAYLSTQAVAAGDWPRGQLMGGEVYGRRLGLIGFGAIAQETAKRAQALGMAIAAYDPFLPVESEAWRGVERLSFEGLLESADIISLHTPLNDATRSMIDASAIAKMKDGAILINAARGGIVDEAALADALRRGALAGAALDVFEAEPLTAAGGSVFAGLSNVILTPHIAGVTAESNRRVSRLTLENILRALDGVK